MLAGVAKRLGANNFAETQDGSSIPRLLRDTRRFENGERRRDPQSGSKARAQTPPGRQQGQDDRGGKIQTDQRGLRSSRRPGEAQEIRRARRELEPAGRIPTPTGMGRAAGRRLPSLWYW